MSIDSKLREAFHDWSEDMARRGILDCDTPREGETVAEWMRRKLAEYGREVPE